MPIDNPKSGPVEKFYLLKLHSQAMIAAGYRLETLRRMSCDELRSIIKRLNLDADTE